MKVPEMMLSTDTAPAELLLRTVINIISILIIVRAIYYPANKQREYVFSFALFNIVVFITCLLLGSARINLGFAFGLFAVFSILRYRTVMIPVKEMGYMFVSISLGMLNALVAADENYIVLIAANILILAFVYGLERYTGWEASKEILYERINLITPEKRTELIEDLRTRTGLPVQRVDIISIDLLHDTAMIRVYYRV